MKERNSAVTSRENAAQTNHEQQTGGELAVAPCSASEASNKQDYLQTLLGDGLVKIATDPNGGFTYKITGKVNEEFEKMLRVGYAPLMDEATSKTRAGIRTGPGWSVPSTETKSFHFKMGSYLPKFRAGRSCTVPGKTYFSVVN